MWVAAVVLHGYAVWVCPLVGERPCRRGCSGPGYVRRVVWGYRVKPGGEPCLLVGGGGGGGGAVVGGDEVQQGPQSVEGKGKGKLLGRSPNSSVSVIPTCPSQHPFRLVGSPTP